MNEIHNVKIGDVFYERGSKNLKCKVIDFYEIKSVTTGKHIKYMCIAKGITGISENEFEVPFATVQRYKLTMNK